MTAQDELTIHYHECMPLFIALGDELRLQIIEILTRAFAHRADHPNGLNVNEITEQTQLSRPAVSHHLKILKEAGLVEVTRCGTSNYYRVTMTDCNQRLMKLGTLAKEFYDSVE
ncbi:MAG: metalloregulator ArsR/SmtB family transcription factor [Clostridiales bacterium]|nr:metalloregulator ArsR/SmtB family transcription factor [Clostridiales bacterium]